MLFDVAVFILLLLIVRAEEKGDSPSGEKAVVVLCLLPILFCLYAFIIQYQTQKQLRNIKSKCLNLSKNTEAMAGAAAKASLGPITKQVLLKYAQTQRQLAKLLPDS